MIGNKQAEKGGTARGCGRKRHRWRLKCRAGDFVLAPFARQGHPKGGHELSVRPAAIDELDRIGGKGRGSFEATLCQPWYVAAALLEVLAVHDYRAEALVRRDVVVDILRGVGFAIHQKPAVAEPDILEQHDVGIDGFRAGVFQRDAPKPDRLGRVQLEADAMTDAAGFAGPRKGAVAAGEANVCAGTNDLGHCWPGAAGP